MVAKNSLSLLLLYLACCTPALASSDTLSIYFPLNSSVLTEEATQQLDAAIYKSAISESHPLQIIGYADVTGSEAYNLRLSNLRAISVKRYLLQSGFRPERITLVIGKGEEQSSKGRESDPTTRRVDLVRTHATASIELPQPPATPPPVTQRTVSNTDISIVAVGELLVLDKIFFEPGRHFFLESSTKALDDLSATLKAHPKVKISIEGHVCCTPGTADGMDEDTHKSELSVNRAIAVRNYLLRKGIAEHRLEFKGLGGSQRLVWPEHTDEDMSQNRRVEIRIID